MPSITVKNNKTKNLVATKIILSGVEKVEIDLEHAFVVTAKQAFCCVKLGNHYFKNQEKYGELEHFIKYLSNNFKQIELETREGSVVGTELNPRFLNKLKRLISGLIIVDWHEKHGLLKKQ
ncbi:hypothetical protein NVT87_15350 [Acinetobacter radioresistens]|uniref:hypothetical protein n=1 Tax=Acinetobacter radioresistens TaxID=40216 RepID=UPI002246CBF0|nr:hypothetical protein [Acinetobacter radioresistens]MCX0332243.1 hypothetical protein [Acinetobacter radioresistens]